MKQSHIYLIGPGGVGKSTVGELAARQLDWSFVDLDTCFCDQVANIGVYIQKHGYESYVRRNSDLFITLTSTFATTRYIMALSSGFLSTDVLPSVIQMNRSLATDEGECILLLPSLDYYEAEDIVVQRQMLRGFNLNEDKERAKFSERFHDYLEITQNRIVSAEMPTIVAQKVVDLILRK